jgi:hypothetical protein
MHIFVIGRSATHLTLVFVMAVPNFIFVKWHSQVDLM